ncbi:hypothetical protein [Streptomyces sp. NPDC010273]|uniref:hypothetical protein n=1 Tax=Streptomyces sp. NPDC010273 TaxID=3364829 RepID=UPI0036E78AD5
MTRRIWRSGGRSGTEWRSVAAVMVREGWSVYDIEQDVQGREWARDRGARRYRAVVRHVARQQERQDARD